ncbi:MAG: NADH-quinone oxidoreductase subunit J [Nocardiopsaceae bacterium]|nr:NADH-quinone oxidoreductase subunit J [Nocardiopsaceae bacterium]
MHSDKGDTVITHILAAGGGGTNLDADFSQAAFWVLAVASVGAAIAMICVRQAVHCALLLAVVMLSLALMYAMQAAPFLAFVQIIVYTGAVLMLFLFVMMLIGVNTADSLRETIKGQRVWAGLGGVAFMALLILGVGHATVGSAPDTLSRNQPGNLPGLAKLIFTTYVYPFEVTSALLITAALAGMVLAHRERTSPKPTQRELARQKLAGSQLVPEPPPGVYALHDAVDMPAMLPDGSTSPRSVSSAISQRDTALGRDPQARVAEDLEAERRVQVPESRVGIEAGGHGGETR